MEERYAEEMQTLRDLLAIMHEHDLETIKVKLGDAIYELSRAAPAPVNGAAPISQESVAQTPASPGVTKVLAPLTGVF